MQDFKKLEVWQNAFGFSKDIYQATKKFPDEEKFGIVSQLRRAAVSVGANIAEGRGRSSDKDFSRFLYNSYGSLKECEHLIRLSKELGYLDDETHIDLLSQIEVVSRKLNNLIKTLTGAHGPRPMAQGE